MCDIIENYTINIDGNEFTVEIHPDYDKGLPWHEHDGYGAIEQRRYSRGYRPEKAPHEVILHTENGDVFIYDIKATIKKAKSEGWSIANPPANWTKKQIRAEAVKRDMTECKKWITSDNFWVVVGVSYTKNPDYVDYLGGVEASYSNGGFDDAKEHAQEMAQSLASQIKKEKSELEYWASRDVCTV